LKYGDLTVFKKTVRHLEFLKIKFLTDDRDKRVTMTDRHEIWHSDSYVPS